MPEIPFIDFDDVEEALTWTAVADCLAEGHRSPPGELGDLLLQRAPDSILNRAAWIDGLGIALKSVTIFPENVRREKPLPSIQGLVIYFEDETGSPKALLDGTLVTKWKTAGDSVLGARLLARPDSKRLLICGAGTVARSLVEAYGEVFPGLEEILIWNRTQDKAAALVKDMQPLGYPVRLVEDLISAAGSVDILSSATMTQQPILSGDWIAPGCHVDLIGAFKPDMREADDSLMKKAELFVDSRLTTLHDIGELRIPLEQGVISEAEVLGDLFDLVEGRAGRSGPEAITLYKNGGGAHLDLMTTKLIYDLYSAKAG